MSITSSRSVGDHRDGGLERFATYELQHTRQSLACFCELAAAAHVDTELMTRDAPRYAIRERSWVPNVGRAHRSRVEMMASRKRPSAEDRVQAIRIALSGMASGADLGDLRFELYPLHPKNNTFPGEVFLELAADAIEEAGASREEPIEFERIRERYLPECTAHTKVQHQHSKYALRAAAMIRAGVDPGLLDEIIWWQTDDLWVWALDALAVYVRVAADRSGVRTAEVCERLAQRHGVVLDMPN
jgi:hypothetical protein